MKFIIPQREDLTREVIKEEFFKTYYPEMKVRQGWWYIHGRYVMLQKNPFVCAKFDVKQKDKGAKTQIRMNKDSNFWTYIIGAPIIGNFIHGDFFEDVEGNFKKFLMKKYGFNESEIEIERPSFKRFLSDCWKYLKYALLYLLLFFIVFLIPNLIDNMRPRDGFESNIFMNDTPACVEDIINKENPGPNDYFNIEYLTPDILWVIHDDKYSFYGLDGKPAHNLTVWAFENKDSYVSFAIIAAILFAVILYFWRKRERKGNEDITSVSPDETIRYERTEDSDTTLKL